MAKRRGIIGEFFLFLREHKSYWLVPLIVIFVIFAALIFLVNIGGGAISWAMYTAW